MSDRDGDVERSRVARLSEELADALLRIEAIQREAAAAQAALTSQVADLQRTVRMTRYEEEVASGQREELRSWITDVERQRSNAVVALDGARREASAARQEADAAGQEAAAARREAEAARHELATVNEQLAAARRELAETHAMYAEAFTSRSWRWTRPLRRESRAAGHAGPVADHESAAADDGGGAASGGDGLPGPSIAAAEPTTSRTPVATHRVVPRTAVVAHIFYPELWKPLRAQLANLQDPYDLYVSLTDGFSDFLVADISEAFPHATVRVCANRGRDIAPFVEFIQAGALDNYAAILKLHSKRSPHRADGDQWRTALWHGLLPSPDDVRKFASLVAHNPEVGCVTAPGNVYHLESLGANSARLAKLLARVGLDLRAEELEFPAGSMYWLDGTVVELLKAIFPTDAEDFESESGQVDGTTAHAFERLIGVLLKRRGQIMVSTREVGAIPDRPDWYGAPAPTVLAFYLPQFHRTTENSDGYGEGSVDWADVTTATSWHSDQRFPRKPTPGLGEYDLAVGSTPAAQARLAQANGIDGFLIYHHWVSGRRLLNAPMDLVLQNPDWPFPHALVWANEDWTRSEGGSDEVLIAQGYEAGWPALLVDSMLPHLRDHRYLHVGGRPLVAIFKPALLPDLRGGLEELRDRASSQGVGDLHLAGVLHDGDTPKLLGAADAGIDSWIEFPPLSGPVPTAARGVVPEDPSRGSVYDYPSLVDQNHFTAMFDGRPVHPGAMPSWDSTPRRKTGAASFAHANPADFRRWLLVLRRRLARVSAPDSLVCLNAWNGWGETAYLEPDNRTGMANLEAVRSVFGTTPAS